MSEGAEESLKVGSKNTPLYGLYRSVSFCIVCIVLYRLHRKKYKNGLKKGTKKKKISEKVHLSRKKEVKKVVKGSLSEEILQKGPLKWTSSGTKNKIISRKGSLKPDRTTYNK